MRILFDQGTPVPLRRHLAEHDVETAYERGWSGLQNGDLLAAAETDGFDAIVTTDQNFRYQQNLDSRTLAIPVLATTDWRRIRRQTERVVQAMGALRSGAFVEIDFDS